MEETNLCIEAIQSKYSCICCVNNIDSHNLLLTGRKCIGDNTLQKLAWLLGENTVVELCKARPKNSTRICLSCFNKLNKAYGFFLNSTAIARCYLAVKNPRMELAVVDDSAASVAEITTNSAGSDNIRLPAEEIIETEIEEPPTKRSRLECETKQSQSTDHVSPTDITGGHSSQNVSLEGQSSRVEHLGNLSLAPPTVTVERAGASVGPAVRSAPDKDSSYKGAVRETDIGITEYIGSHQGFTGVIKQRYSDFLVNEIDLDGNIVHLTNTDIPEKEKEVVCNVDMITSETWNELQNLLDGATVSQTVVISAPEDKLVRTEIHKVIKENFKGLESSTEVINGSRVIQVKVKGATGSRKDNSWPPGRPDYCHFVMYKENKDTMEACNLLSKFTRMKPGAFTYAGTKDKRAKTSQMLSVNRMEAERLKGLNNVLRGLTLGNFSYKKQPLRLGDLQGNHFTIILRNVMGERSQIDEAVTSLRDSGFINYFGAQRFGTTAVPTHHVGRAILCSKWQEAVELILKPRIGDVDQVNEARCWWWETRDAKAALEKIKRPCIERHLLVGLSKSDRNDLVGAMGSIPRNSRLMYIHSYQSFIWNSLVSRRLQKYGMVAVAGDLVMHKHNSDGANVHTLTEANQSEYSIQDVVMPLPGYDVVYPSHEAGLWYQEMLESDDLSSAKLKHKNRDYSLSGGYRKMVLKPTDVSWDTLYYDDVTRPLLLSDYDRMDETTLEASQGDKMALKLEFSLPSSTYATMAIREILKTDTSAAHQSTLNVT